MEFQSVSPWEKSPRTRGCSRQESGREGPYVSLAIVSDDWHPCKKSLSKRKARISWRVRESARNGGIEAFRGVSTLLSKRPGFVFGIGCSGKGIPSPAHRCKSVAHCHGATLSKIDIRSAVPGHCTLVTIDQIPKRGLVLITDSSLAYSSLRHKVIAAHDIDQVEQHAADRGREYLKVAWVWREAFRGRRQRHGARRRWQTL